jgi:hypothetical protein
MKMPVWAATIAALVLSGVPARAQGTPGPAPADPPPAPQQPYPQQPPPGQPYPQQPYPQQPPPGQAYPQQPPPQEPAAYPEQPPPGQPPLSPTPPAPQEHRGPPTVSQPPREGTLYEDGTGQAPFYEPLATERLQLPPPPPPPDMKVTLSAYTQGHLFTGPVRGTLGEVGVKVGFKALAIEAGYLPGAGLGVIGLQFLRYTGAVLSEPKPGMRLSFLTPGIAVEVATEFDEDVFGILEMSGPGLGFASCGEGGKLPFFGQLRAPNVALWLPFMAAGGGIDEGRNAPFLSWGFTLEAGLLFY